MSKGNLQVEEGISNWLLVTIVLSCASPAVTLNVWPRVEAILSSGWSSNQFGIVLLVTLSALGMTCVPFAMKKADNIGFWLISLLFGIGLGILNYTMAVGAVGKSRDEEAGGKALLIQKAATLRTSIAEGEKSRRDLPAFKWTTQEMVQTAIRAVDLAREARDQECGKVGDICRARVTQLFSRQSELAVASTERATTERAERLDADVRDSRELLVGLGSIPESSDQQASRIASVIGVFLSLGQGASEKVATGLIHFLALCAEAFALGMPRIIVTALSNPNFKKEAWRALRHPILEGREYAEQQSAVPPSINVPRTSAKAPRRPDAIRLNFAGVSEWKSNSLIRSTGRIRDWEAFESYKGFAKVKTLSPVSFLEFDKELQTLGVRKETDPALKRDFYLEVAIKTTLKAVS